MVTANEFEDHSDLKIEKLIQNVFGNGKTNISNKPLCDINQNKWFKIMVMIGIDNIFSNNFIHNWTKVEGNRGFYGYLFLLQNIVQKEEYKIYNVTSEEIDKMFLKFKTK